MELRLFGTWGFRHFSYFIRFGDDQREPDPRWQQACSIYNIGHLFRNPVLYRESDAQTHDPFFYYHGAGSTAYFPGTVYVLRIC